jgi:hypothetical protein
LNLTIISFARSGVAQLLFSCTFFDSYPFLPFPFVVVMSSSSSSGRSQKENSSNPSNTDRKQASTSAQGAQDNKQQVSSSQSILMQSIYRSNQFD